MSENTQPDGPKRHWLDRANLLFVLATISGVGGLFKIFDSLPHVPYWMAVSSKPVFTYAFWCWAVCAVISGIVGNTSDRKSRSWVCRVCAYRLPQCVKVTCFFNIVWAVVIVVDGCFSTFWPWPALCALSVIGNAFILFVLDNGKQEAEAKVRQLGGRIRHFITAEG